MGKVSLHELEERVLTYVNTLRDSPEKRVESRQAFYAKYGDELPADPFGYGDAEMAFLGWEERSVLRPPHHVPAGSPWWSAVNLHFIYFSELGAAAFESGFPASELPVAAKFWVHFIQEPAPMTWYRAHNSSIIDGYLTYSVLAGKENIPEQVFLNMVLYRLLFAQSMVEGKSFFPRLTRILGDPRGEGVKFITHLDAYYPDHYPMDREEMREVMGRAHNLSELGVEFFDDVLIEPELSDLYKEAADWNEQPDLITLIKNHRPSYPKNSKLPRPARALIIRILAFLINLFRKKPAKPRFNK